MKEKLAKEKTTVPPHGGTLKNLMIDDPGEKKELIGSPGTCPG